MNLIAPLIQIADRTQATDMHHLTGESAIKIRKGGIVAVDDDTHDRRPESLFNALSLQRRPEPVAIDLRKGVVVAVIEHLEVRESPEKIGKERLSFGIVFMGC